MAGNGRHALKVSFFSSLFVYFQTNYQHDPAIDRWYQMREEMYKNFRLTRSSARTSFILMVLVPGMLGWILASQDLKWDWTAKRKGESLLRQSAPREREGIDA